MFFKKKVFYFNLFNFLFIFVIGCSFENNLKQEKNNQENLSEISLTTWNTQTFFDGITDGTEYSEFQNQKNWNNDKYISRLEKICKVINLLNSDIFILEEIENDAVMQDISNKLAGNSWNKKNTWPYASFSKKARDALGCGIFSKYPISYVKNHSLNIKTENSDQPSMRPISEICINVDNKNLIIFINHWKSKYGGEEETKKWRNWQENLLNYSACKKKETNYVIAVGDFNRDASDFNIITSQSEAKRNITNTSLSGHLLNLNSIKVFSPWFNSDGNYSTEIGSYYYKGNWERIDNIFAISNNITISDFTPATEGPWVNENKQPLRYEYYNGQGYSDHLPLKCTLIF